MKFVPLVLTLGSGKASDNFGLLDIYLYIYIYMFLNIYTYIYRYIDSCARICVCARVCISSQTKLIKSSPDLMSASSVKSL